MPCTYTFPVQAALFGLSSLFPLSKYLTRVNGSTAGYGVRPALNTSQQVIPNDHWKIKWIIMWVRDLFEQSCYRVSSPYVWHCMHVTNHICLFSENTIQKTFQGHPFDREFDDTFFFHIPIQNMSEIVFGVDVFWETKVSYFDDKIVIDPGYKINYLYLTNLDIHHTHACIFTCNFLLPSLCAQIFVQQDTPFLWQFGDTLQEAFS